eukprot:gene11536-4789_t
MWLLCILGFFFYHDLTSINIGLIMTSCSHLGMCAVRGRLAPKYLYDEHSMKTVNMLNVGFGILILFCVLMSLVFEFDKLKDEKKTQ